MRLLAGLSLLLVAELEWLLVNHYEIRTALRQLLHLPLYHILLTLLTLTGLTAWLRPASFHGLRPRLSGLALGLHLTSFGLIGWHLSSLYSGLSQLSPGLAAVAWLALGVWLLTSWLASWLPLACWVQALRQQGAWLWGALFLSWLAPYLAEATTGWWSGMAWLTFQATDSLLYLLYPDSVSDPDSLLLGTSRFVVEVRPGCSGLEGMGLMALLASAYLWLRHERLRFPLALLLIPIGMGVVWVANLFRLVALVSIGAFISPDLAMRGFHSQAGWIAFTVIGLLLIWLTESRGWLAQNPSSPSAPAPSPPQPELAYVLPLTLMLLGGMVVQAFTQDFAYLYPLKVAGPALALWFFRREYYGVLGRPGWSGGLVGLLMLAIWLSLVPPSPAPSPYEKLGPEAASLWLVLRILGTAAVVPLVEELAFRGYLLRRLRAVEFERVAWEWPGWFPVLFSSALFASLHTQHGAAFLAGLAYSGLCRPRARLSDALVAHAVTNAGLAAWACIHEAWWLLA